MNLPLHPPLAAEDLARAVGEDLVDVHVRLRPAAGLPDDERELGVVRALEDFIGRLDDRLADLRVLELLQVEVDPCRGPLDLRQRMDERQGHPVGVGGDLEVLERALGLGPPEAVGGDLHLAHGVGFDAEGGHRGDSLIS